MAKHKGITIRVGAAHDEVRVPRHSVDSMGRALPDVVFDRSQMRKEGAKHLQGALRREVVDTWAVLNEERTNGKGRRAQRIAGKVRDKVRHSR